MRPTLIVAYHLLGCVHAATRGMLTAFVTYVASPIQPAEAIIQRVEARLAWSRFGSRERRVKIPGMAQEPGRTLIDADTSIDGKIHGKDATIAGKFKGEIHLKGSLVLASTASVEATVQAELAEIAGALSGKITARKIIVLETGKVTGTIDAGQLVVREGAILNGPVVAGKSAAGPAAHAGAPPAPAAPATPAAPTAPLKS